MIKKLLIPKAGLVVRDLHGRRLPVKGAVKTFSAFWRRRVKDGDVIAQQPPKQPKAAKSKSGIKGDNT
ncbi:DUF2635 domain-containing protein [Agarivorans sp. B2Z047]|uniref:DUF2635 domain-containing protein n=1 Tax=Agarivorans sp. B2Z047 TaxID=2652721 RepID=UPI00128B5FA0|nr:DUF2635 domain-containing protein [Agarivorans sp. B2Z047]MPW30461.1 DUF2635 domain-containing protein [Agarivorans sp. B2Z047]UQN42318.1 DUF2635 domain-containing protein [Agarivorans sp. B2Z047]